MQIANLNNKFDKLQKKYGDIALDCICGAGCILKPDICFVFMNPTARNVSADKNWTGLKAPWIGTKNVWKLFMSTNLLSNDLYEKTKRMKLSDWDYDFAQNLYKEISSNKIYITNLSKATQKDARHLSDDVFKEYLRLMKEELSILNPKIVISFGNQVSSILLNKNINVSKYRKQMVSLYVDRKEYKIYPVYYPVGQGMRNINKAIEDIKWIQYKNNISGLSVDSRA